MATVRKRNWQSGGTIKTAWIADYFDQDGKRHIRTCKTKKEADGFLLQARHEVARGIHTPENASITVAEAGELWITQAKTDGLEESTIRQYRQHLDKHIAPFLGNATLAQLSSTAIPGFRNTLLREGRSPAMTKKVLISLGAILAEAMDHGKVARNVVHEQPKSKRRRHRQIESRHREEVKAGADFPTMEEVQAMLGKAAGKFRPFFVAAVFTGMRASELRGLTWDDVDLKGKTVKVRQRANLWGAIGPTKSEAGRREIPLSPLVIKMLREWKLACPQSEMNLVFPNGKGNVENHANLTNRGFDPLQIAAGIVNREGKPKYGLHALRHFYASLAIRRYPPKRAQTLLGHGSIRMTYDIYGHLFPDAEGDQEKAIAIEDAVLRC